MLSALFSAEVKSTMKTVEEVLDEVREAAVEFWDFPGRLGVNSRGAFGNSPLFTVITWGDSEAVEVLLGAGAELNFVGEHGETPLHHAIQMGEFKIARRLVQGGADCEAENHEGKKPRDCCWEGEWQGLFGSNPSPPV